jgi:hypothetical protein
MSNDLGHEIRSPQADLDGAARELLGIAGYAYAHTMRQTRRSREPVAVSTNIQSTPNTSPRKSDLKSTRPAPVLADGADLRLLWSAPFNEPIVLPNRRLGGVLLRLRRGSKPLSNDVRHPCSLAVGEWTASGNVCPQAAAHEHQRDEQSKD